MPPHQPQILRYTRWLERERGLSFDPTTHAGYDAMWRWSVGDLNAFWDTVWDYFDVQSPTPHARVLADAVMPGARWFEGAQLNYARQVFRHADAADAAGCPAIVFADERMLERGELQQIGWPELRRQVASLAARFTRLGIVAGDRVCAFLPNSPPTVVAFLAAASVGAVWSICSPDMGPVAVLDRFRQIAPKLLIGCDGYVYAGKTHGRMAVMRELLDGLPSVENVVLWRNVGHADGNNGDASDDATASSDGAAASLAAATRQAHDFADCIADADAAATFEPRWLPFDHPLWVVYSSGTTGLPKPIVHGHGGVVVEALKACAFHHDLGPSADTGDRYHWYSATGWIMWNSQVNALLNGTTICLFDGSPGGRSGAAADWTTLWRFAAAAGVTFFGAGAAFYASCLKAGIEPATAADLSALRAIGSTGSPLAAECYRWLWAHLPKVDGRDIWLNALSGGTDFAGAFVGGVPTLPVVEGEMQCRWLGAAVEAWSEADAEGHGRPLVGEVGELVCVKPLPSMPLYFWGDDGGRRYRDSYFDMYTDAAGRPVWRHGDWIRITPTGGAVIYGRSDATINRHGIRMGTAELYRAVEAMPEVLDSLVVDLEYLGRDSYMPLFVVLRDGVPLDVALTGRMRDAIKTALTSRHVPNDIFQVASLPRTLSGKKMELPVKKLLLGTPAEQLFKLDAMVNADGVAWFVDFAARRQAAGA